MDHSLEYVRDLMRLGKLEEATKITDAEIERLSSREEVAPEVWDLRFIHARILDARGRAEDALNYLESFVPPADDKARLRGSLKMYRAEYSGFLGRYETSHRLFTEAATVAADAELFELLGEIHLTRAFVSFRQKDYVSSTALFHSALELAEKVGGWRLRGHGLWGIGKNLMIQEHYMDALLWLERSLEIFEGADAPLAIAMVWSELAVCHLGLGDDEKAMELFRKAERVNSECGVVHNYQVVLANIGNVYLHRRDYFTAISYYQRALALAREIKDPVSVKKWTRNINLAYARIRQAVDQATPTIV